ncbi:hypothetical protein JUJ52_02600 [Virgibacillus sp. AGTR]|uniref:hypothetical protein n=1 Tax=Virgibacillus sp. AGTR TaxID=2812055 RepID=UPI001D160FE1|nr:hypothetical protein [Virgibacillus sp. AGTR]MCC2248849.1 hypothetical protein [Virgibacillus sp. AGTR]
MKVTVRKTLIGLLALQTITFIGKLGLVNRDQFIGIANFMLFNDKTFKMKVNNGKWMPLDLSERELR